MRLSRILYFDTIVRTQHSLPYFYGPRLTDHSHILSNFLLILVFVLGFCSYGLWFWLCKYRLSSRVCSLSLSQRRLQATGPVRIRFPLFFLSLRPYSRTCGGTPTPLQCWKEDMHPFHDTLLDGISTFHFSSLKRMTSKCNVVTKFPDVGSRGSFSIAMLLFLLYSCGICKLKNLHTVSSSVYDYEARRHTCSLSYSP